MKFIIQTDGVIVLHPIFFFAQDYVVEQLEGSSKKIWDRSMLLKEDMEAVWSKKQEAAIKRERTKKNTSSHRVTNCILLWLFLDYVPFG